MCPNPIVNVPIRNRIVQVQSEQAANSGVVRISTHNREGHPPRVRSYLAYLYCYYSKPSSLFLSTVVKSSVESCFPSTLSTLEARFWVIWVPVGSPASFSFSVVV